MIKIKRKRGDYKTLYQYGLESIQERNKLIIDRKNKILKIKQNILDQK